MNKELVLGLDIGSSSVRGALYDTRGRMVRGSLARRESPLTPTGDGGSEVEAEKLFKLVVGLIDEVHDLSDVNSRITSVASCAFWHSLLGVDAGGRPVTPIYSWADNRSREYVCKLRSHFDEDSVRNRTGCHFHSSYWPAKLLWIRRENEEAWSAADRWLSSSDLLSLKFCGKAETSLSMASGTGLFDIHKLEWDSELLKYLRLPNAALRTIGTEQPFLKKWQRRWPRLADAVWHPPVADGAANNVGSGAVDGSTAALMVGTSAALRVILNPPPGKIPEGLFCYRLDADRFVLGGALSDGGGMYEWLRRNLQIEMADAALGKEIRRRGPAGHGLGFMPFLAGERSTGYNDFAAGSIHGLTIAHDSVDILQAAMESVAYRLAEILDRIETLTPVERIVASGGALKASSVWAQMIADVFGRDLELFPDGEASMSGAVLLALRTTGKIELSDKAASTFSKITYNPETRSAYKIARERHIRQYRSIHPKP